MSLLRVDHVQLAMPPGQEDAARDFYAGVLELYEIDKPVNLARRGGCWFERDGLKVHLGIDADFVPARKAHPAFVVSHFEALLDRCISCGYEVITDSALEGTVRAFVNDPFGDRIELLKEDLSA
jgi:catechol 2,3-dioxygenase-like lactoylglutathione lyase family enzyme